MSHQEMGRLKKSEVVAGLVTKLVEGWCGFESLEAQIFFCLKNHLLLWVYALSSM